MLLSVTPLLADRAVADLCNCCCCCCCCCGVENRLSLLLPSLVWRRGPSTGLPSDASIASNSPGGPSAVWCSRWPSGANLKPCAGSMLQGAIAMRQVFSIHLDGFNKSCFLECTQSV